MIIQNVDGIHPVNLSLQENETEFGFVKGYWFKMNNISRARADVGTRAIELNKL